MELAGTLETSAYFLSHYTASHLWRLQSSLPVPWESQTSNCRLNMSYPKSVTNFQTFKKLQLLAV